MMPQSMSTVFVLFAGVAVLVIFGIFGFDSWIEQTTAATSSVKDCDPSQQLPTRQYKSNYTQYLPAPVEDYVIKNAKALGYETSGNVNAKGCNIFTNKTSPVYNDLHVYLKELEDYNKLLKNFTGVPDLRLRIEEEEEVCKSVELHPDGLKGIFRSGQLSLSSSGFVEPLLPPLRHPNFCFDRHKWLMNMDYLVHDFGAMCHKLKRHSRTVLIDMGASLDFHKGSGDMPAVYLTEIYEKMGFPFDHVYAYEITPKVPKEVFELVPDKLQAAYHWINVAVDPTPGSRMNPLTTLLSKYNEEDFIVIKLDVDKNSVELPLAKQLLEDDRFANLVDQFYFEHHVHLAEISRDWLSSMKGSVKDSLDLFYGLRRKGIPAHYWV